MTTRASAGLSTGQIVLIVAIALGFFIALVALILYIRRRIIRLQILDEEARIARKVREVKGKHAFAPMYVPSAFSLVPTGNDNGGDGMDEKRKGNLTGGAGRSWRRSLTSNVGSIPIGLGTPAYSEVHEIPPPMPPNPFLDQKESRMQRISRAWDTGRTRSSWYSRDSTGETVLEGQQGGVPLWRREDIAGAESGGRRFSRPQFGRGSRNFF